MCIIGAWDCELVLKWIGASQKQKGVRNSKGQVGEVWFLHKGKLACLSSWNCK
jgi:hypothetical protein